MQVAVSSISIHAPVKGATHKNFFDGSPQLRISIHAPVKGATLGSRWQDCLDHDFNPRTREGCDEGNAKATKRGFTISIHAPVKGATLLGTTAEHVHEYFNPRTREGCDPLPAKIFH